MTNYVPDSEVPPHMAELDNYDEPDPPAPADGCDPLGDLWRQLNPDTQHETERSFDRVRNELDNLRTALRRFNRTDAEDCEACGVSPGTCPFHEGQGSVVDELDTRVEERDEWRRRAQEAGDEHDKTIHRLNEVATERDALQARIDAALTWCPVEPPEVTSGFAYQACVKQIRLALLPVPADDSSEAKRTYSDVLIDAEDAFLADLKEPATSVHSDAENESPPFTVGQWVRCKQTGCVWQASESDVARQQQWWTIESWQPHRGERVTGRTRESTPQEVTSTYRRSCESFDNCAMLDPGDNLLPLHVYASSLRPAGGEQ